MIEIHVRREGNLMERVAKQIPFALSRTINATLLGIQQATQDALPKKFQLRQRGFIQRMVKIGRGDFATKATLVGRVGIQGERSDLLAKFEAGGHKVSFQGKPWIAYPSKDIRGKTGKVPPRFQLSKFKPFGRATSLTSLELRGKSRVRKPREMDVGQQGSFFIRLRRGPLAGAPALAQRTGQRQRLRLLYLFVPFVRIPAVLQFFETGRRIVNRDFAQNFLTALREALKTAR
jgi:hypothetical protein